MSSITLRFYEFLLVLVIGEAEGIHKDINKKVISVETNWWSSISGVRYAYHMGLWKCQGVYGNAQVQPSSVCVKC